MHTCSQLSCKQTCVTGGYGPNAEEEGAFLQRRKSNEEPALSAAGRNSARSWVVTIRVPAYQVADFKNCCMLSGKFDGSDRHHFFQGMKYRPFRYAPKRALTSGCFGSAYDLR